MNHRLAFKYIVQYGVAVVLLCGYLWGQQPFYYKYLNEDGIQVFTNIPPSGKVYDLTITGSARPEQEAVEEETEAEAPPEKEEAYKEIIEKYAADYDLDPSLIKSIISAESGFNARAVSPKGARGLMQLMPATAERLGVNNSFDPDQNIRGGVKHFRSLMDSFNNDLELSLAAYNAGENLVARIGRVPNIKETKEYVETVTARYGKRTVEKQEEQEDQEEESEKHPPAFRFVDDSGILHLTNIPPSD